MSNYDDIIGLPHRESVSRPRMPQQKRAAQFSSFAALTGLDSIIEETARQTDERSELSEDRARQINECLQILIEKISEKPEAEITFFVPDKFKSGGEYRTVRGNVRRVDEVLRVVTFTDGREVAVADIYDICVVF